MHAQLLDHLLKAIGAGLEVMVNLLQGAGRLKPIEMMIKGNLSDLPGGSAAAVAEWLGGCGGGHRLIAPER